ncbi:MULTISPECIES: hypothetical protein [unclassified Variovorax]|uniref:hypothetical protein n=1 Tax=unclassified Variovorax TaxID=663243 RepID=UPI00076C276D|nr:MULTISPECIES: hypothetical protein [unclassified Variovorax]KWT98650.1 hypothetical protein APY03_0233 [Variovorax sp. WDL1]PNG59377.1 hypothetical protein CHC07_01104 [Variovorax sp. B4]PNG60832.1 hypothetical protein CHC06_00731 [Variovorax sp. B2]VTV13248.1 hypothetical protein WDL1CHR_03933 [Variovorax sp. WDL1]
MKARRASCIVAASLLALAAAAPAATTHRVDDTGTYLSPPTTPMRWRQLAPGRAGDNTVEGRATVALRLNLSPWLNRPARLYMGLAPTEGEQMIAAWRTQGRLLPGSVRGGGRTLVFEGVVREPFLQESIELDLSADGRSVDRAQSLQFFFEIEVTP